MQIYLCHKISGQKLKDIGLHFGIGVSGVSQASRRVALQIKDDKKLKKRLIKLFQISTCQLCTYAFLKLSLSDNADLLMGASLNSGKRPEEDSIQDFQIKSEIGTYSDFWFAEIKV